MRMHDSGPAAKPSGREEDPIRVHLLSATDTAWEEWLSDVPRDVYHTAGYHAYAQESGEGEPYLLVVGDRRRAMVWPYLLRRVSEVGELAGSDATDVTSVYGYPGPLAWGCGPGDPFLSSAWSEIQEVWREQRAVAAFTRFHPLLDNASLLSGLRSPSHVGAEMEPVVPVGQTVSIECSLSEEAARAGYAGTLRRQIDASRRAGLSTTHDVSWTDLANFAQLYRETMVRSGAAGYYFFDEADFQRLRVALAGHLHLLVTRLDDVVAAAGLFTEFGGIVQAHLVATNDAAVSLSPSKVLLDDSRRWARERGDVVLHLGGGRGGREDSLFTFKSRFSDRRHLFHVGRWILDRTAYEDLLEVRLTGRPDGRVLDPTFFPAYRAPLVEAGPPSAAREGT